MVTTDKDPASAKDQAAALVRAGYEIFATLLDFRDERTLLNNVIGRLIEAYAFDAGTILLHDGQSLTMSVTCADTPEGSPFIDLEQLLTRLQEHRIYGELCIIVDPDDLAELLGDSLGDTKLLVVAPLVTHGAPMGTIAIAANTPRLLESVEEEMLRLVGLQLATVLREKRLQVRLDAYSSKLAQARTSQAMDTLNDALTGLPNRQFIIEETERAVEDAVQTGGQLSLLLIDIDRFRSVNERYGLQYGDTVLKKIAGAIQTSIRGLDMAARYDGASFTILLPSTPGIGAVVVAERLRDRLSTMTFNGGDGIWTLSVSIGVASLSTAVTTVDDLLRKAAMCLQQGKQMGGSQVVIDWEEALSHMGDENE